MHTQKVEIIYGGSLSSSHKYRREIGSDLILLNGHILVESFSVINQVLLALSATRLSADSEIEKLIRLPGCSLGELALVLSCVIIELDPGARGARRAAATVETLITHTFPWMVRGMGYEGIWVR